MLNLKKIQRQSLEEIEKWLYLCLSKGSTQQARTVSLPGGLGRGFLIYPQEGVVCFFFCKFTAKSWHHVAQQPGLVSLKLFAVSFFPLRCRILPGRVGGECQVQSIIYMESESKWLCEGQAQLQVFVSSNS